MGVGEGCQGSGLGLAGFAPRQVCVAPGLLLPLSLLPKALWMSLLSFARRLETHVLLFRPGVCLGPSGLLSDHPPALLQPAGEHEAPSPPTPPQPSGSRQGTGARQPANTGLPGFWDPPQPPMCSPRTWGWGGGGGLPCLPLLAHRCGVTGVTPVPAEPFWVVWPASSCRSLVSPRVASSPVPAGAVPGGSRQQ